MAQPRIISLLPSATEILCAVGGESLLVGRSHECDFPPGITDRPVLTAQRVRAATSAEIDRQVRQALAADDPAGSRSLYTLDADRLANLKPDLILTQDLCEVCSIDLHAVRTIAADLDPKPEILSLNPEAIDDVFDDMLRVGEAAGLERSARDAVSMLRERYWQAREYVNAYIPGINVAFLEWMDPLFVGGHWTPELIEQAGGTHPLNPPRAKSRQIEPGELLASKPDRIIICPCGYDLDQVLRELPALASQPWWQSLPPVKNNDVMLVDGNRMFNRPGPRLVDALEWLVGWLNDRPEMIPQDFPVMPAPDPCGETR